MKYDTHLIPSDEPLKAGEDHKAHCGRIIVKAHWTFQYDSKDWQGGFCYDQTRVCKKCQGPSPITRYLYGAVDGQLVREKSCD